MKILAVLLLLAAPSGVEFPIQAKGSVLRILVDKTGIYSGKRHILEFSGLDGKLVLDESNPAAAKVELQVKASEFELRDDWLSSKDSKSVSEYAVSDKVLDAGHHPVIRFQSTSVERLQADTWNVKGQLEIRGISKPVELLARQTGSGNALAFEGNANFGMKQFGIKPPSAALGLIGTKEQLRLEFRLKVR